MGIRHSTLRGVSRTQHYPTIAAHGVPIRPPIFGKEIPVEMRNAEEVRSMRDGTVISASDVQVFNPAFDVTPAELVTAIITDRGVVYPPFEESLRRLCTPENSR